MTTKREGLPKHLLVLKN